MRKLTLLTVILLTVCLVGAFAELTGVGAPTASGSASVTVGYDLDNEGFGFVNDSSITLKLPLVDGSAGADGMDDMYGEITVDEIGWEVDDALYDVDEDDTDALDFSVSAKLVIKPLEIGIGQPDFENNKVDVSDDYVVDAYGDVTGDTGGISIGYVSDMITVTGMIATKGDYRDASDVDAAEADTDHGTPFTNDTTDDGETDAGDEVLTNNPSDLAFGATASVAPADGITVDVAFFMDPKTDAKDYTDKAADGLLATETISTTEDLMAVGLNAVVEMAPLTLTVPVDFVSFGDASGFELNPMIGFTVMEGLQLDADFLFGSYTDVTVGAAPIENAVMGAGLTLTDTESLVGGLSNTVEFSLTDMSNYLDAADHSMGWGLDVDTTYAMGGLGPYVNFGYGSDEVFDLGIGATLGADFTGIDNTVITVDFTNEALTESAAGADSEKGRFTVDITVSF